MQQFVFDLSRYKFEKQSLIKEEDVVEVYGRGPIGRYAKWLKQAVCKTVT